MDWYLAAPFIHDANDLWLTSFVPDATGRFHAVPATYQHSRSRRLTGLGGWADYFQHGARVWHAARRATVPSGILTCFPQLPLTIGLQKRLSRSDIPIVRHESQAIEPVRIPRDGIAEAAPFKKSR